MQKQITWEIIDITDYWSLEQIPKDAVSRVFTTSLKFPRGIKLDSFSPCCTGFQNDYMS